MIEGMKGKGKLKGMKKRKGIDKKEVELGKVRKEIRGMCKGLMGCREVEKLLIGKCGMKVDKLWENVVEGGECG